MEIRLPAQSMFLWIGKWMPRSTGRRVTSPRVVRAAVSGDWQLSAQCRTCACGLWH